MTGGGFTIYGDENPDREDRACRFCGAELLTPDRIANGICEAPDCHAKMIEESGKAIIARKRAKHAEVSAEVLARAEPEVDQAFAALKAGPEAVTIGVMPWQNRPLVPLPPERLAAFREHLGTVVEFAFRDLVADQDLSVREADEPEEAPEVLAACGTCQGMCCKRGGDTALLLPSDIARYRQRNPQATADEVMDLYLSHLPARSARDACVYQAENGCNLPRALRQDICNSYYCDSLRWLRQAWREQKTDKAIFVAANQENLPKKVAILDGQAGYREVARIRTEDSS